MTKTANFLIVLSAAICFVSLTAMTAEAQKRRSTRSTNRAAAPKTSTAAASNTAAVKAGAEKVGNQVKNLTIFIYRLGRSVPLITSVDADAKAGKLSPAAVQQAETGKQGLVLTIRTFKNAMATLESDFRANPALKPYLLQLTGVAELAGDAEQQAASGQFEQAGRTLIEVIGQLTDVLRAMP